MQQIALGCGVRVTRSQDPDQFGVVVDGLEQVVELAAAGQLVPTVSEVFPLADAADAHRAVESGHSTGKVILRTTQQD